LGLIAVLVATVARAQDQPAGPPPQQHQGRGTEGAEGGQRPLFGKITAIKGNSIEIAGRDGQTVTVNLTSQTDFRKDRETAKVSDFKVGDMVMVRGDENADHTVTAKMISGRTGGAGGPGGGPGGGQGMPPMGTLGKDYVAGEVKAIDAPKITVLRTDNVTQVIELNEETSLRKGRDSITMADIQVGDHVMARGAIQNNAFVPKGVMVMNPEQWKRIEGMAPSGDAAKPANPEATAPKPQE
jgi:hypothetical protein